MNPTIIFSGGGTLGSVTPLLAISAELKNRRPDWTQCWIGTIDGPEEKLVETRMPFYALPTVKLRRYFSWGTVGDIFRLPSLLIQTYRLLKKLQPTVIVSAGGYVSVPVGLVGHFLKAQVLIHQQDVRSGLANRLLSRWADQITVTWSGSLANFPANKTTLTGNPVRSDIVAGDAERGRKKYSLNQQQPLILVIGGGTGAARLNELVDELRPLLKNKATIFHLTGSARGRVSADESDYISRPLLVEDMGDIMKAADLVISRAGLGTLTELSALQKPTIVIPMPNTHQEDNAAALEMTNAAIVLDQRQLTSTALAKEITAILSDEVRQKELSARMGEWNKAHAAGTIASLIEKLTA